MITTEQFINIVIIFLIITTFGYLLGLSITNVVDQRLSDISINLPKINLPKQTIYVNFDMESIRNQKSDQLKSIKIDNEFKSNQSDQGPNFELKPTNPTIKPLNQTQLTEGFTNKNDNETTIEDKKIIQKSSVRQNILVPHYGTTYYKDPKEMTDRQLSKFKTKAKFNKMTLQDYVNWLQLFETESGQLNNFNRQNLIKIQNGNRLIIDDIPKTAINPDQIETKYNEQVYELE